MNNCTARRCKTQVLPGGTIVTVPRTDVMYAERAKAMISIAHPDYGEELEREAHTTGLIPRGFF